MDELSPVASVRSPWVPLELYDGCTAGQLRDALRVPRVALFATVETTMDVAHALAAAGAPSGTLVLADAQSAGRGRMGRSWRSEPGAGIWLTLVERPSDLAALDVLSLRIGLAAAATLDVFSPCPVMLKWPNDLYVGDRKLAGVLVEARWRGTRLDWLALGLGLNVRAPVGEPRAAELLPGVSRVAVLEQLVPALREATERSGHLSAAELEAFAQRDLARGRKCVEPAVGTVAGVDPGGALIVDRPAEQGWKRQKFRAGSLVLASGTDDDSARRSESARARDGSREAP